MDLFRTTDTAIARYDAFMERVNSVFTPFGPVASHEFFIGRLDYIERLRQELKSQGRQAVLYGDRGVGKTSLARVMPFFLGLDDLQVVHIRCTSDTRFADLARDIIVKTGTSHRETKRRTRKGRSVSVGKNEVAAASRTHAIETEEETIADLRQVLNELIVGSFKEERRIIVIDDYDRVTRPGVHKRVAKFLKQLSDELCNTKCLLVGVSDSVEELFRDEPSLPRCLAGIHLKRFSDDELRHIIEQASSALAISFDDRATSAIVGMADRFASHLHLLALHAVRACAEEFWNQTSQWPPRSRLAVMSKHIDAGVAAAIDSAEQRLRVSYEKATATTWRKTQLFQYLIWSVAMADSTEMHVSDIASGMTYLADDTIAEKKISYHLGKLQEQAKGQILSKVRSGVHRFSDPLMRGFVRLQLHRYNVLRREGQLELPFMREDRANRATRWAPTKDRE